MADRKTLALIAWAATLAGCHTDDTRATPAQYEQAKLDCAAYGGLQDILVWISTDHDEIHERCTDRVEIVRPVNPKDTPR